MYKRAQEMFEIFWKKSNPNVRIGWDNLADATKRGWWEVAISEESWPIIWPMFGRLRSTA